MELVGYNKHVTKGKFVSVSLNELSGYVYNSAVNYVTVSTFDFSSREAKQRSRCSYYSRGPNREIIRTSLLPLP